MLSQSIPRLLGAAFITFTGLACADSVVFQIGADPSGTDSTFCPGAGGCQVGSGGINVSTNGTTGNTYSLYAPTVGINAYSVHRDPFSGSASINNAICDRCLLSFTSGGYVPAASDPAAGTFTFGPGSGSFSLSGYVVPPVSANHPNSPPVIASGSPQINTFAVSVPGGAQPGKTGSFSGSASWLVTSLDPSLFAAFGVTAPTAAHPYQALLSLSFKVLSVGDQYHPGFTTDTVQTSGTLTLTPAPEPYTIVLTGIGLAGLGVFRRRLVA